MTNTLSDSHGVFATLAALGENVNNSRRRRWLLGNVSSVAGSSAEGCAGKSTALARLAQDMGFANRLPLFYRVTHRAPTRSHKGEYRVVLKLPIAVHLLELEVGDKDSTNYCTECTAYQSSYLVMFSGMFSSIRSAKTMKVFYCLRIPQSDHSQLPNIKSTARLMHVPTG